MEHCLCQSFWRSVSLWREEEILFLRLSSKHAMGSGAGVAQNPPWQVKPVQQGSITSSRRRPRTVHWPGQGCQQVASERTEGMCRVYHVPPSTTHVGGGVTMGPMEDVVLDVLEVVVSDVVGLSVVVELVELVEEDKLDTVDELVSLAEVVDEEEEVAE